MGNDSKIKVSWQRLFDRVGAAWLITLGVGIQHAHANGGHIFAAYPQSMAVVDDFGTLVAVEAYQ